MALHALVGELEDLLEHGLRQRLKKAVRAVSRPGRDLLHLVDPEVIRGPDHGVALLQLHPVVAVEEGETASRVILVQIERAAAVDERAVIGVRVNLGAGLVLEKPVHVRIGHRRSSQRMERVECIEVSVIAIHHFLGGFVDVERLRPLGQLDTLERRVRVHPGAGLRTVVQLALALSSPVLFDQKGTLRVGEQARDVKDQIRELDRAPAYRGDAWLRVLGVDLFDRGERLGAHHRSPVRRHRHAVARGARFGVARQDSRSSY